MTGIIAVTLFRFLSAVRSLQHVNSAWIKHEERILCILTLSNSVFRLEQSKDVLFFEGLLPGVRTNTRLMWYETT